MTNFPSKYEQDFLDVLLDKNGYENPAIWDKTLDFEQLDIDLSPEVTDFFKGDDEALYIIQREILDCRIIILRAIFNLLFNNGVHPKRVIRNTYILAKKFYPQSLAHLTQSQIALLTDDSCTAMSMRAKAMNQRLKNADKGLQDEIIAEMDSESLRYLSSHSYTPRGKKQKMKNKRNNKKRNQQITPDIPGLQDF